MVLLNGSINKTKTLMLKLRISFNRSPSYEALDKQVKNELPTDLLASGKNKAVQAESITG